MKYLSAILIIVSIFISSFSSYSQTLLIKNNTAFYLQFIRAKADDVPSNYKEFKLPITYKGDVLGNMPGYFEIAPNETDAFIFGFIYPMSVKQSTSINWKNLSELGSPPFSVQIENEKANHPGQAPLLIIGTKNLGLSWDVKMKWVTEAEATQLLGERADLKKLKF